MSQKLTIVVRSFNISYTPYRNYFIRPSIFYGSNFGSFQKKVNRFLSMLEKLAKSYILERNICGLGKSRKDVIFYFFSITVVILHTSCITHGCETK